MAIQAIDELTEEGIYFIGFGVGHVGLLLKKEGDLFLIHSNYLFPNAVHKGPLAESIVFKSFSTFYLVEISTNELLMQRWLKGTEID